MAPDTAATIYAAERPAPVVKELPRTNVTRKCGVCGDFASSVITFYRRNPFDHTAWRPAQHDRCRRHTPATEGAQ